MSREFVADLEYNIVLIGFMGAGKSTVSSYLNKTYGMEVVEMDEMIARKEGKSIPEIFEQFGEPYFRNQETVLLRELQSQKNLVISCGGGVAMRKENVPLMKQNGCVVLLTATPETVLERVKEDENRPILQGRKNIQGITELLEHRRESYESVADIQIATDGKSVKEICDELMKRLQDEWEKKHV